MNCPCEQCICLAICRHKRYLNMFRDCDILRIYEPHYQSVTRRTAVRIINIVRILEPTIWKYVLYKHFNDHYMVVDAKVYKATYSEEEKMWNVSYGNGENPV